ncbi:Zinc finger and BTB domain-containing protein [Trichinella spiralis]|uniref:Zinc finger and BTB domain-containing protein n=1 Tax=Trichinella spiralis TaxID=6334 RepID=A0ABR3K709_TRISP
METNYFCELCNKDFPTCSRYQMHMNIHLGIRPFACQTCGKRFNNRGAKHNHMKCTAMYYHTIVRYVENRFTGNCL